MRHFKTKTVIVLALSIFSATASAMDNNPTPAVLRVNHCGTFDRQFFLDNRNPQWGDTMTIQLWRAANAKCEELEAIGTLSYNHPTTAYSAGRALGVFSDGMNHNDPFNSGSFDGYDNSGNLLYSLTGANFACIERVEGSVSTVAPSIQCPPFSGDTPGGTGSTGGGTGNGGGGFTGNHFNLAEYEQAVNFLIQGAGGNTGPVKPSGYQVAVGHILLQLSSYFNLTGDPESEERSLLASASHFNTAITSDPENLEALKFSATALVALTRFENEDVRYTHFQEAEKRLLLVEERVRGMGAYNLACIMALQGKTRSARRWLEYAKRHGGLPTEDILKRDGDLDSLRSYRWFHRFSARVADSFERRIHREH
ncbi:MAG: hypothetical protein VYA34_02530 [Myxococcota bacterium]|nr:hypothetical protein [Myxococcota bacterium]